MLFRFNFPARCASIFYSYMQERTIKHYIGYTLNLRFFTAYWVWNIIFFINYYAIDNVSVNTMPFLFHTTKPILT